MVHETSVDLEIIRILLERGASVLSTNFRGCTPLLYAGSNRNPEVFRVLLEHGAVVSAADQGGSTVLHAAARQNDNPEIIRLHSTSIREKCSSECNLPGLQEYTTSSRGSLQQKFRYHKIVGRLWRSDGGS